MFIRTMILIVICFGYTHGQLWIQNDVIFNPSGVPSLAFSQPRFADLDGDEDADMILGNINGSPRYFENVGSTTSPQFAQGPDIFHNVEALDSEMAVCADLDGDGDLDLVTGGYTGLQLYDNMGDATSAEFQKIENFFSDLSVGSNPVPHLADLDNDDDLDLVVGFSEGGEVRYFENFGTADEAIFLPEEVQLWFDVGLYAYPWFADLDADGDQDLLIGRDGYGFRFYRNTGTGSSWVWTENNSEFGGLGNATYWNSPCLVDLTGDGKLDLVHGNASGPLMYYRNSGSLGNASWTEVTSLFGGVLDVGGASHPYFIDFDGDGDQDMLSGSTLGDIKYYENVGNQYGPAWSANHGLFASIDHSIYSSVAAGDLDNDGMIDLVVGDLSGALYFHRNTGTGFPLQAGLFDGVNAGGWSSPFLMDMDRDHDLDLILGREDGQISYYQNTGTVENALWSEEPNYFSGIDVGSNAVVSLGDVNLDGNLDMVTGDLFHEVQFFSNENGTWVEYPDVLAGLVVGQNAAPALVDLNSDGDLDMAVGNYDGTFNYFENQTVVATEPSPEIPSHFNLSAAYPNPFNPSTTIAFELGENMDISLQIYNVRGNLVAELDDGYHKAGSFHLVWQGVDLNQRPVPSGVYLVLLQSGTKRFTEKVTLLK